MSFVILIKNEDGSLYGFNFLSQHAPDMPTKSSEILQFQTLEEVNSAIEKLPCTYNYEIFQWTGDVENIDVTPWKKDYVIMIKDKKGGYHSRTVNKSTYLRWKELAKKDEDNMLCVNEKDWWY